MFSKTSNKYRTNHQEISDKHMIKISIHIKPHKKIFEIIWKKKNSLKREHFHTFTQENTYNFIHSNKNF